MELAMIGLGKMGLNMATRLVRGGHRVIGFAPHAPSVEAAVQNGAEGSRSVQEASSKLAAPRIAWLMVPSGAVTEDTLNQVSNLLKPGDTVIDGGNSNYKDTLRHASTPGIKGD